MEQDFSSLFSSSQQGDDVGRRSSSSCRRSRTCEEAVLHLLPCSIAFTGPAPVKRFFQVYYYLPPIITTSAEDKPLAIQGGPLSNHRSSTTTTSSPSPKTITSSTPTAVHSVFDDTTTTTLLPSAIDFNMQSRLHGRRLQGAAIALPSLPPFSKFLAFTGLLSHDVTKKLFNTSNKTIKCKQIIPQMELQTICYWKQDEVPQASDEMFQWLFYGNLGRAMHCESDDDEQEETGHTDG